MRLFDEIRDDYMMNHYGRLADRYNSSRLLLTGGRADNSIKIEKLFLEAKSNNENFDNIVRETIGNNYNTDFLDFSLVTGLYFGVYNLYCYSKISYDVRDKIVKASINKDKSLEFLKNNSRIIYNYINEKYGISEDEFSTIISQLFVIRDDNSLYNNGIVRDIVFIMIGNTLYCEDFKSNEFIGCSECINYFRQENDQIVSRIH